MAVINMPGDPDDSGDRATPAEPSAPAVQYDGELKLKAEDDRGQQGVEVRHSPSPDTVAWATVITAVLSVVIAAAAVLTMVLTR